MVRNYFAVMMGGALGACARYGVSEWLHVSPWNVMGINWVGCLLLGFLTAWAARAGRMPEWLRVGLGTGVLGGFTTFSTFSVESVNLLQAGQWLSLAVYVLGSLLGGVLLAGFGMRLGQRATLSAREVTR